MLATWHDLADVTVQGLVGGWFDLRQQVEKTITYLLSPHHAPYLYTDDHLMTAFVATEAYHRVRISGTAVDPEELQRRVEAVVAAAPDDHRDWSRRMLMDRNQKGQTTKLKEVVERSGATGQAILAASPRFVKLAVASRNMVAHPGPAGTEPGATYLAVAYGLRWMLRHCLLVDMGLSEHRTAELIRVSKLFRDERELIQRWTAG